MALSAQYPKMRLIGGQLGSPERLRAGLEQLFVDKQTDPGLRIILFHGPRPSKIERDTGVFLFEGSTPATAMLGVYAFTSDEYVSVAPRPKFVRGDAPLTSGQPGLTTPQDPALMVDEDDRDYFHVVFPKHASKVPAYCDYSGQDLSPYMRGLGNGFAPTWGLVSLKGGEPGNWADIFPNAPSTEAHTCTVTRYDGKSQDISAYNAQWPYLHYVTVGDWKRDPTANLTLYKGAQDSLTAKPREVAFHRLRLRMPSMVSVPMVTPDTSGDAGASA